MRRLTILALRAAPLIASLVVLPLAGHPSIAQAADQTGTRAEPLPPQVDLRGEFAHYDLPPRRQGRRNTCSVFTTAAALEFALSRHLDRASPLSVEYLNWACNQIVHNHTADRGQFFHHLLKAYERYGICAEGEMPYRRRFDPELEPSDEAAQAAREMLARPLAVHWINPLKKEAGLSDEQFLEIKRVLAAGWPVAAGSGHSRLLVGYADDAEQPGGGTFYTKDSGSGRFSKVTYEFVKMKVGDVFWIDAPVATTSPESGDKK